MKEKEYLLIDSVDYSEYFINELKNKYIPITTDIYLKAFFESRGIKTIGILKYLSKMQIKEIYLDTSRMVDLFLDELDQINSGLYKRIFGREGVRFFYSTNKYEFKRFLVSCFKFLKGLESIIDNTDMTRLNYLHDNSIKFLCGNVQYHVFIFPDNICWRILEYWNYTQKPKTVLLKAPARSMAKEKPFSLIDTLKRPLWKIKRKLLLKYRGKYSSHKKTLLFLSPPYDLLSMLSSREMIKKYNIINWNIDYDIKPEFLTGQPIHPFFVTGDEKQIEDINQKEIIEKFNFNVGGIEKLIPLKDFKFLSFVVPLIKDFLNKKLLEIIRYWRTIESFHKTTKVDILFWSNPPHRYPEGIVTEFCQLNKIPVVGMQHGGMYGSNRAESTHFDLDYEKCDFYFSYGFNTDDLKRAYPDKKNLPEVIPMGSTKIFNFATTYKSKYRKKIKVKILYALEFFQHFFWKGEIVISSKELLHFQKRIVDLLRLYVQKDRIILKFYPRTYTKNPLKPYLDNLGSHGLEIVDNISFRKILEKYDAELILLDVCSTALNESCVTKSNIIAYNDQHFAPLTENAFRMLNKRAIVCNTQEDFLDKLKDCLDDKIPEKDLENREFLEKYCIYKGNPKDNIIRSIGHILNRFS